MQLQIPITNSCHVFKMAKLWGKNCRFAKKEQLTASFLERLALFTLNNNPVALVNAKVVEVL